LQEELEGCAARYGVEHSETLASARHLVALLQTSPQRAAEAEAVRATYRLGEEAPRLELPETAAA